MCVWRRFTLTTLLFDRDNDARLQELYSQNKTSVGLAKILADECGVLFDAARRRVKCAVFHFLPTLKGLIIILQLPPNIGSKWFARYKKGLLANKNCVRGVGFTQAGYLGFTK